MIKYDAHMQDLLAQIIRVGKVVNRDEAGMRVRVEFLDTVTNALTSDFLQVLVSRAKKDCVYDLPDIGDQVLCLFLPFGKEVGFVLGAMYGADKPPADSGGIWKRVFEDGTILEYDRTNHKLLADVQGDVEIRALKGITADAGTKITAKAVTSIDLTAPQIFQNGNVTTQGANGGSATVQEQAQRTITGSLTVNGTVTINGNLDVNGNSNASTRTGGRIP